MVIECAYDVDFFTSGKNSEMKMQDIVSYHMKMHEATGGKVQKKVSLFCWR